MTVTSDLSNEQGIERKLMPRIGRPISATVTNYETGRALLMVTLPGMPFESENDSVIVNRFDGMNRYLAALAKDKGNKLAIWTFIKRRTMTLKGHYAFTNTFMKQFIEKYLVRFDSQEFFSNTFSIALLLKYDDVAEGAKELEELGESVAENWSVYDPEILTTYQHNGVLFSQTYEFLAELLNGVDERIPVTERPGAELIMNSRAHFGYDVGALVSASSTKYVTCYDMKDFASSSWGQFNPLMSVPAEFTIVQSFGCLGTYEAQKSISSKINKLDSAGDKATHERIDMVHAQGYIASGELAFGDYHGALMVYGDTAKQAIDRGTKVAASSLGECGTRWIKASLSAPVTFLSQIPGFAKKPRPMLKATRNLAASFSMHNYSTGKASGNPLGDGSALMPLKTRANGLYALNTHYSRPKEDSIGDKLAGHTTLLGATGTGKTVLQLAIVGFMERFDPKIFAIDVDRGMEIFIRALGGVYLPLKANEATGLAPFALPDTGTNRDFLYDLVGVCGKNEAGALSVDEKSWIKVAVDAVMVLPLEQRWFSRLLESIPVTGPDSLAVRLHAWCQTTQGRFAWVFDNDPAHMFDVTRYRRIGFDVTDFLKDGYDPTAPILAMLFHLKDLMQVNGGLLVTIVEEFWLPLKFEITAEQILKTLKTGRKLDEMMLLVSQSPEDAIGSPLWAAIRDQTATKIYLANPNAEYGSYQKCNLTPKEFAELKALDTNSHTFLIKQANQSCFAKLDLLGMRDELAVLSGSAQGLVFMEAAIAEVGDDPDRWLPRFHELRRQKARADADSYQQALEITA